GGTVGEALPEGQAAGALQIGALPTQTDVKNRWPDGSIKFAIVSANVPSAGNYPVTSAPAAGGSFAPVVPSASAMLTVGGVAYVASLPPTPGSDSWLGGPLVQEWRTVITPLAGATPHPFLPAALDHPAFNRGNAH